MARDNSYQALILKRQPLGEADEIVTLFTQEIGKLRVKTSATRLTTSKLQYGLQPAFLINARIVGNDSLPKLIGTQVQNSFPILHDNYELMQAWFVIAELLLKSTPDQQANPGLFTTTLECLQDLEQEPTAFRSHLLEFKINLLSGVGLGIPESKLAEARRDFNTLERMVNEFLSFQLEREINATKFLQQWMQSPQS